MQTLNWHQTDSKEEKCKKAKCSLVFFLINSMMRICKSTHVKRNYVLILVKKFLAGLERVGTGL